LISSAGRQRQTQKGFEIIHPNPLTIKGNASYLWFMETRFKPHKKLGVPIMFRVFDVRCGGIVSKHRSADSAKKAQSKASALYAVAAPDQDIRLKAFVGAGLISNQQRVAFGDYVAL
jgi:hypothetical protein